jgi:hypothetical protein
VSEKDDSSQGLDKPLKGDKKGGATRTVEVADHSI